MRQILMTVLLLMTVVLLYAGIVGGDEGTKGQLGSSGEVMANAISRISP